MRGCGCLRSFYNSNVLGVEQCGADFFQRNGVRHPLWGAWDAFLELVDFPGRRHVDRLSDDAA